MIADCNSKFQVWKATVTYLFFTCVPVYVLNHTFRAPVIHTIFIVPTNFEQIFELDGYKLFVKPFLKNNTYTVMSFSRQVFLY